MASSIRNRDLVARLTFFVSASFLIFLAGFAASHFGWLQPLALALQQAREATAPAPLATALHVHPARHDLVGAAEPAGGPGPTPGTTLVATHWPDRGELPGLALLDRGGTILHRWIVDPPAIWAGAARDDSVGAGLDRTDNSIHGAWLFADGDVLFNVEYVGLARMDAAGRIVWRLDRRTHHSVHAAEDGTFWVCACRWVEDPAEVARRLPGLVAPLVEDSVLQVDAGGRILTEISILELIHRSEHRALLWKLSRTRSGDLLHLNDVEPLPAAIAPQYPGFAAGDLLVSLRDLGLVLVFDPATLQIRWSATGPFLAQHDPDFVGDGWISVFDNRTDWSLDGHFLGGSRLIALHVTSGEQKQLYPHASAPPPGERRFYTGMCGMAQALPEGRWLLTEAQAGRVFEVDRHGRTVWEWGHQRRADGITVSEVQEGSRWPYTADDVRRWQRR
jgi:hypothetical protein